jgi:CubicO group peptidase (beta-lactamase class C family)
MSNAPRNWFAGLLVALLALPAAARAETPAKAKSTGDARRAQVSLAVAAALERHQVPGASLAIVEGYQIAWADGFGRRAASSDDPVGVDTRFQAASISKPVTALAVLKLVEQGKMNLDDNVNERLTSWHIPDSPLAKDRPVTLRRLLSHTAGLTVHGFAGYSADAPCPSLLQVLDGAPPANSRPIRLDVKPGYMVRYSGGGYCILQQLIIDTAGMSFPDFMKAQVLGPLGMVHSTYQQPLPGALVEQAAFGHRLDGSVIVGNYHTYPEMAAAGLWTTPTDLAKVVIDLAKSTSRDQGKVLSQKTATEMLTVQKGDIGLGIIVQGEGAKLRFGHSGANEGYRCDMLGIPATGQGLVIMTNSDNGGAMFEEVVKAAADAYAWPALK